jgi:preprotein translocase subunit SecF
MKRVIRFSRARYGFFAFSGTLILIGIVGFILNLPNGLNLGVDFKAGIAYQFQVAPDSFTVQYAGPDGAQLSIPAGEQALTSPGDIIFSITSAKDGTKTSYPFSYKNYTSVQELAAAIMAKVSGVTVTLKGDPQSKPTDLLPLAQPADIKAAAVYISLSPAVDHSVPTSIAEVRGLLGSMGEFTIQEVAPTVNQEFIARFPEAANVDEKTFQTSTRTALMNILEGKYGQGRIIIKSTEFVGPRMAQSLASQTIWLVLIAVTLILVYMLLRFHPWIYGVAAVLGILHDALVMVGFDAVFRVEFDAGTIAAILTILGYSINDTIVNFDRARENTNLMRGESLRNLLDTSVTQTLGRTFITSGATLLTVIALFILTTGTIQRFALNMIVGILEGTYSTFISAFIVIEWTAASERRRKRREGIKYGIATTAAPAAALAAAPASVVGAVPDEIENEQDPATVPGAFGTEAELEAGTPAAAVAVEGTVPSDGQPASGQPAAATPPRPAAAGQPNVLTFPGSQGSRKHKKHRRRHH